MTHEDGKPHIMSRRFEIIVSAILGPIIVIVAVGVWASSVRTRDNEAAIEVASVQDRQYETRVMRRFGDLEARVQTVEVLNQHIATIQATQAGFIELYEVAVTENRDDHDEMKQSMRENRKFFSTYMQEMKGDLIREFHKNSNGGH